MDWKGVKKATLGLVWMTATAMVGLGPWPKGLPDCLAQNGTDGSPVKATVRADKPSPSAPSRRLSSMLADLAPQGWAMFGPVREFTPRNLYEQINGRAEFFLAYDMIGMTFAGFMNPSKKGEFIELSIYDMGTATNAFGVFSGERSPGVPLVGLGRAGYRLDANYYIWKGPFYVRIMSSEGRDKLRHITMGLAQKVTSLLNDSDEEVWGLKALPLQDRVKGSVQYFKRDAMGLDFMKHTYTAQYRKGGLEVTAFLSLRDSERTAQGVVEKYKTHASTYGKGVVAIKEKGVDLLVCDMDGTYDVVFHKGRLVSGVSSVEERGLAIRTAAELWERLKPE